MSSRLVNATGEPVWVRLNTGQVVLLPEVGPPVLLTSPGERVTVTFDVAGSDADVWVINEWDTLGVLEDLPEVEGTRYLVRDHTARDFPYRTDFVQPALWEMEFHDQDGLDHRRILAGIAPNTAPPVATANTPRVDLD